jgi:hypothetical protein
MSQEKTQETDPVVDAWLEGKTVSVGGEVLLSCSVSILDIRYLATLVRTDQIDRDIKIVKGKAGHDKD